MTTNEKLSYKRLVGDVIIRIGQQGGRRLLMGETPHSTLPDADLLTDQGGWHASFSLGLAEA